LKKKNISLTVIGVILAGPVMFIWHIIGGIIGGFKIFFSLQKEWWTLVLEDFRENI